MGQRGRGEGEQENLREGRGGKGQRGRGAKGGQREGIEDKRIRGQERRERGEGRGRRTR
jgi:hypothetical protein